LHIKILNNKGPCNNITAIKPENETKLVWKNYESVKM
jgi:hypothetical protein